MALERFKLDGQVAIVTGAGKGIDTLIALEPDCVVYTALGEPRPMEAIEQVSRFLAAEINVVGTPMVWLVTPRQTDDRLRVPLEEACRASDSSLYVNGIDPGYSGDTAVLAALSLATRAKSGTGRRYSTTATTMTTNTPVRQWVSAQRPPMICPWRFSRA